MPFGYNGKRLVVDLTRGRTRVEEPDEVWYRTYLGGMGSIAYHLLKEVPSGCDPLSPQNILVMSTGVVTGAPFSGSGRNSVGAKSPLTGGFGDAEAGGFWQAELKHAGFDEIVFTGSSEEPVWLWIEDGKAMLRDATDLWGLEVGECQDKMREITDVPDAKTALIGPAGERMVRISCVINDLNHVAGRSGMGAAMGSKRLKGVAVKGRNPPELADPEKVRDLAKRLIGRVQTEAKGLHDYGTGAAMDVYAETGNLPTRNFRDGAWEHASEIDAIAVKDEYRVNMGTCYSCAVRCKKEVELGEPYNVEARYGGPEYETLGSLGSDCGVSDLAAICKANELCQRYGLDTIGTGTTIAFAMECYENNIITDVDTGGVELCFGNADAMVTMVRMIGERKGIGDVLAEGTKRAAEHFGKGAKQYAVHVKGQEVPMHEPRLKRGLGLGYAVSPTGADHCHNIHDTVMTEINYEKLRPLGILEKVPVDSLGPEKVSLFKHWMEMRILANCMVVCQFPPWRFIEFRDLVEGVTGWDVSMHELVKVADRTLNLARLFNLREGFSDGDDWLPQRFFQPQTSGALSDTPVDPVDLRNAIDYYYQMMGWDGEGVPRPGVLYELGVGWAVDYLPQMYVL